MDFNSGDILFQDMGCGRVCDAINGSTPGWNGAEINHCGIVFARDGDDVVFEAISPKVRMTPLHEFLNRHLDGLNRPRIIHSRLRSVHHHLIPDALNFSLHAMGIPYDHQFGADNTAIYCSELLVDAFKHANGGIEFFPEQPMTFKDPNTGQVLQYWKDYYTMFGVPVPVGEIGSNPGDISMSDKFDEMRPLGQLRGLVL